MLDELDETIRALLSAEIPIRNGEVEVTFDQPSRTNSARWKKPAVDFFLYDLRENNVLRQHQWEQQPSGGQQARLKRTPYRLDCLYMLTTWANDAETEHRLMSRCLLALFRHPVLPKALLAGSLKNQPFDLQARLASHDRLTNPAEVWASLDNEMRPSVSYVVTLALDPWKEEPVELVRTVTLRPGQAPTPQVEQRLSELGRAGEMHWIGGRVLAGGAALAGVSVSVRGSGLLCSSDQHGRFTLGSLPPGEHVLVARPAGGRPVEKKVFVPARDGNYDLNVD